jgi:hypothetical protein
MTEVPPGGSVAEVLQFPAGIWRMYYAYSLLFFLSHLKCFTSPAVSFAFVVFRLPLVQLAGCLFYIPVFVIKLLSLLCVFFPNVDFRFKHSLFQNYPVKSLWKEVLTPWSRVLLEKLIVTQLVKFPVFYGIRRFTRARHCSMS